MRNIAETLYKFFLTLFYITTYRYIYKLQSHRRKINVLLIIWYKCIDTQIRQKIVVCYLTFNCWHLRLKKLTRLVTVNYQREDVIIILQSEKLFYNNLYKPLNKVLLIDAFPKLNL